MLDWAPTTTPPAAGTAMQPSVFELDPRAISPHVLLGDFRRGADYGIVRAHGRGEHLVLWTREGGGAIRQGDDVLRLRPHSLAVFLPRTVQDYRTDPAVGHWSLLWAHLPIDDGWPGWTRLPHWRPGVVHQPIVDAAVAADVDRLIADAVAFYSSRYRHAAALAVGSIRQALMIAADAAVADDRDPRVRDLLAYLADHRDRRIDLADCARLCRCSVSRIAHLFRREVGVAPMRHLEDLRMQRARELLAGSELSIQAIARRCGFDDPLYFSNRFRRRHGLAPSAWRAGEQP